MRENVLKKRVMAAVCAAMCVVFAQLLPLISGIGVGLVLQMPIILCSIFCGSSAGILCAMAGIVLSSAVLGRPTMVLVPVLLGECAMYGGLTGAIFRLYRGSNMNKHLNMCILSSGLVGRLAGGILFSLLYAQGFRSMISCCLLYTAAGVPAVVIWLVLIPAMVKYLEDAGMPMLPGKNNPIQKKKRKNNLLFLSSQFCVRMTRKR